jgi:hypothetical protein
MIWKIMDQTQRFAAPAILVCARSLPRRRLSADFLLILPGFQTFALFT